MPDEIKPDASSDEELQEQGQGAAKNSGTPEKLGVAKETNTDDVPDDTPEENGEGVAEDVQEEASGDVPEDEAEAQMLAMLEEEAQRASEPGAQDGGASMSSGEVDEFPDLSNIKMEEPKASPAEFQQLTPSGGKSESHRNIDLLLDVKMPVSIELGRTEMPISELLTLGPGSVVELNKLAGEPVDLLVNDKIIAKGEVVVVDENFGVRITLLMSPEERLKSLAQS